MKLHEITKLQSQLNQIQKALTDKYQEKMAEIHAQLKELQTQETLLLNSIDINLVSTAENILEVKGHIYDICEGECIMDLACVDIANGCKHLATRFYGNKRYEGYYQRNDCEYGYGPRHGCIVDRIGLKPAYSEKTLTEEEKDACIYFLKNYKKIKELCETNEK